MLNLAKVAILAVSNQIGNCTGFQLIFGGGTRRRLVLTANLKSFSNIFPKPKLSHFNTFNNNWLDTDSSRDVNESKNKPSSFL